MAAEKAAAYSTAPGHARFVQHEWDTKLRDLIAGSSNMEPGWRGILYANIGLVEGPSEQAVPWIILTC